MVKGKIFTLFYLVRLVIKIYGIFLGLIDGSLRDILSLKWIYVYWKSKSLVIRIWNEFSGMCVISILFSQ